jgi:hypothetical protein
MALSQLAYSNQWRVPNHDRKGMTKFEGMTNNQMTKDCDVAFSSFGLWASFVIGHSPATPELSEGGCFVICSWMS